MKRDIDILTLGCSKNLVDTERLMGQLQRFGWHCHHDPAVPNSRVAVINTCGFIGDAKEESIATILQFADRKTRGELDQLYVMGCLSQRYAAELPAELPEVDGWFGKFDFMNLIRQLTSYVPEGFQRQLTTPSHYAYLKISEGCNRMCSYCAIPLITGKHQSRSEEDILREAEWMSRQGVKEINVIAQDLSSYGLDLYHEHRLPQLVQQLAHIDGIHWVRLHYTYPTDFPEDLLRVMAEEKTVCKYLDIALQHCTDHLLTLMRRHITAAEQNALIHRIREQVPGIYLRTTLMVGHPGETDEDFAALLDWTRQMHFERMGAFAYSHEEGTYAYRHYADDIPESIKQDRLQRLMALQQDLAEEQQQTLVGQTLEVLIDRKEEGFYVGRTQHDSPEVDPEVLIPIHNNHLQVGNFYPITITRAEAFDLYGQPADSIA